MFKKGLILIISVSMVLVMMGGCTDSTSQTGITSTGDETTYFGQITAIDGNNITVAIGTQQQMPQKDDSQSSDDDADASSSATVNEDGQTGAPEAPQGSQGTPPSGDTAQGDDNAPSGTPPSGDTSRDDGNAPDGMAGTGPGGLELTGEEQTITLSDSTVITVQSGKTAETGTAADLEVGSIVTVVVQNGTVTSITVIQMGMMDGAGATEPSNSSGSQESGNTEEAENKA